MFRLDGGRSRFLESGNMASLSEFWRDFMIFRDGSYLRKSMNVNGSQNMESSASSICDEFDKISFRSLQSLNHKETASKVNFPN